MADPTVGIIILNWNGLDDTCDCLRSLQQVDYPSFYAIVVDNGSEDGSQAVIRKQFAHVTLMQMGKNLGFTGGNNHGIRACLKRGAQYVMLLNNDTEVAPDFLAKLVDAAESDDRLGIAGPTIYYHFRPDLIWSAGGHLTRSGMGCMLGLNQVDSGQFGSVCRPVDFVTGCAMLVKTTVLDRVGMLDERFFAYFEEAEWCVRARTAGFKVVHVPGAKVWHKIPLDARDSSPLVHYYMTRNRLLFLKATGADVAAWAHTLVLEYLRTLVIWTLRPKWRHKRQHLKMMLRAIRDAAAGRWGPIFTR